MRKTKMYSFYYRKNKKHKKWRFLVFLCIIFTLVFCFTFAFLPHTNNIYKSKSYYLLSLKNSKQKGYIDRYESVVTGAGGAGLICKISNNYHIFAFGYFTREDANKVLNDSLKLFEDAQIIETIVPSVKKNIVKNNLKNKKAFEFISSLPKIVYRLAVDADNSQDFFQTYRELERLSIESLDFIEILEDGKTDNISDILLISLKIINGFMNSCKDDIYSGANASIKLKLLFLQCVLEEKNLRDCLNSE